MGNHHTKLTAQERDMIAIWIGGGIKLREIARRLTRSVSTISDGVKRNNYQGNYVAIHAQSVTDERKINARRRHPLKDTATYAYVLKKLKCGWSPEEIAGRLKRKEGDTIICHETIYQFIYAEENKEKKLFEYLPRKQKKRKKQSGRKVLVVPNYSYGRFVIEPIEKELRKLGNVIIQPARIGSTESHGNEYVLHADNTERLFSDETERMIMEEEPIIVMLDGSNSFGRSSRDARYPDAQKGFVNIAIAVNDALGVKYKPENMKRTDEHIAGLRGTEEFKRAVDVYNGVLRRDSPRQPYQFQLWNTAGMELAVRGNREIATTVRPYDGNVEGPAMIFCNVGVLDEQIPEEIKARFEGQHKPAYFDDSGKIIAFDFGFDNFGVRYLNRLETELKGAYDRLNGRQERAPETIPTPAIIGYAMRNLGRTSVEEKVA